MNGITVALGLPQLKILQQKELRSHIKVTVICRRHEAACPWYGKVYPGLRRMKPSSQEALHQAVRSCHEVSLIPFPLLRGRGC